MWNVKKIEDLNFVLISSHNQWCHFRGHGFDVHVNLNTKNGSGNYFNFHSYKSNFKGNFKAIIETEEEFKSLLKMIQ